MTYALHDRVLQSLRGTGPELRNGAPNHAPMVVEALAALARESAILPWLDGYRAGFVETPQAEAAIEGDWRAALGDFTLLGSWQNLFREQLMTAPWRSVMERWLLRLLPGGMAAGTHGIIRCAHACRALANAVTEPRLEELAAALAYCAARYRRLGVTPVLAGPLGLEGALRALPLLQSEVERGGPPPQVVKRLSERLDFGKAVNALAAPAQVPSALAALAELGARLYLQEATRHPLVLLHAVTGPAAVQLLIADASPDFQQIAFAYAWQAVAAWAAAFSRGLSDEPLPRIETSWEELVDLAVASGDAHAIKLTEASRRMDQLRPSPVFRATAGDWIHRVIDTRGWTPAELFNAGIRTRLADV